MTHCFYKPQPRKERWVSVCTTECDPSFNMWATAQEALEYFSEQGYPAELREAEHRHD